MIECHFQHVALFFCVDISLLASARLLFTWLYQQHFSIYIRLACPNTDLPRVHSMPERLYLPRGLMGRIDCPVESNPPLTVIVWSKSGRPIDFQHVRHAKVNKQGTLIFKPVLSTDDGQYSCTPYSPLGAGHQSTHVRVFVRGSWVVQHFFCMDQSVLLQSVLLSIRSFTRSSVRELCKICRFHRFCFGNQCSRLV